MLIFHFCWHLENQRLKLWGSGNLEVFDTTHIYEMAAIFLLFHNGKCWYSIFVDTWKIRYPNFGGGNLEFCHMMHIYKWQPFSLFFKSAKTDIPFPSTLKKPKNQTFGSVSNLEFFCKTHIYEMAAISQYFHND